MSSFLLKIFALFFMIIDHMGFILFPDNILFRAIGRLAFPLFAYQMAVGFFHTKNKKKHILKLLIFAIICQIPHSIMLNLYKSEYSLNIIFTFILALLIIYAFELLKPYSPDSNKFNFKNTLISFFLSLICIIIGVYLNVDYTWYGIALVISFYFSLNKKWLSIILFFLLINLNCLITRSFMALLGYISLFDIIFILFFNGKKGYKCSWLFYIIYALHLLPMLFVKKFLL